MLLKLSQIWHAGTDDSASNSSGVRGVLEELATKGVGGWRRDNMAAKAADAEMPKIVTHFS